MNKKKLTWFERYLFDEIAIEFKACLYFYAILFFYCLYRISCHKMDALILHMAEIIFLNYVMGYVQTYLMGKFDEADRWNFRSCIYMVVCSLIYVGVSYLGNWFDRKLLVSIIYFFYMCFMYACCYWVYKIRRKIDEKIMNKELQAFQARRNN